MNLKNYQEKMIGGFNKREPTNTARVHQHPPVVETFTRHQRMRFFERMIVYDDDLAREFSLSLTPLTRASATTVVKGLSAIITLEVISIITRLPLGLQWRK